jgi:A/G-specific adenine glycosylase
VVIGDHQGELPRTEKELMKLPGIGKATAGSIMAFAFNEPVVFIETNIRRVFIHHFFPGHDQVDDADILPLVGLTLDRQDPREWYYALMDYGAWLAGLIPNPNRRSRHYSRQSPFEGSDRQVRGRMLRKMIREKSCVAEELIREADDPERGAIILKTLIKEGFVCETDRVVRFVDNI